MKTSRLFTIAASVSFLAACSSSVEYNPPVSNHILAEPPTHEILGPLLEEHRMPLAELVEIIEEEMASPFTYVEYDDSINPRMSWADSFSVGDRCYIYSTFDHGAGDLEALTPYGIRTVEQIAQLLGEGDIEQAEAFYNTVQCGHEPDNGFWDELEGACRGRVDIGTEGCGTIGPTWKFDL